MRRKDREREGCDSWWQEGRQASILQSLSPLSQSSSTSRMRMGAAASDVDDDNEGGGLGPSLCLSVASGDRMHSEKRPTASQRVFMEPACLPMEIFTTVEFRRDYEYEVVTHHPHGFNQRFLNNPNNPST